MMKRLNLSKWAVLVVDDDLPSLQLVKDILSRYQADVDTSASGAEALVRLSHMPTPAVILCDVAMPQMDGYVLLEKLRAQESLRRTPFLAVTAQAMLGDRERILAAGFDGYISKPFTVRKFLEEVIAGMEDFVRHLLAEER